MEKKETQQNSFLKTINKNKVKIIFILFFVFFTVISSLSVYYFFFYSKEELSAESIDLFQEAKKKYLEKNLDECIVLLNTLIKKNKNFMNGRFMLGKSYFFNNQTDLAEKTWEQALRINQNHINTLIWLGILYNFNDKTPDRSIKLFNNALELDSLNILANYYLGKIYFKSKEYKKAIYHFNNAVENELQLSEIHLTYAKMYKELDLPDRAKDEVEKALKLSMSDDVLKEIEELNNTLNIKKEVKK